jgi:hypothetical protein
MVSPKRLADGVERGLSAESDQPRAVEVGQQPVHGSADPDPSPAEVMLSVVVPPLLAIRTVSPVPS